MKCANFQRFGGKYEVWYEWTKNLITPTLHLAGTALSFIGGGIFGYTFGAEIANHAFQLYKLDTVAAQVKFFEWWENKRKSKGRS